MNIKKMMDIIIQKNNKYDMDCLGDMFVNMAYGLKETNPWQYKMLKYTMYTMAYGEHMDEEMAKHWVEQMQNKDNTTGPHWTWEETEDVRKRYAPDLNCADFYAALNMMYSDYYCPSFDTNTYVNLAKDWLEDKDVGGAKTLKYYMFVVKK